MVKIFLAVLLIPSICLSANYYVDPTYDGSQGSSNGSFSRPWTTIAQVNNHSFSTSDGLYFKAGTRLIMNASLNIRWSGTPSKRAVVGSYFGENQFGLGGVAKPILDGQNNTVPERGSYSGLVEHKNRAGYVTIQDLEIRDSGGAGIVLGNTYKGRNTTDYPHLETYNIVKNCYIHRSWRRAIEVARAKYNIIDGNVIFEPSYGRFKMPGVAGAGIEITGMNIEGVTQHNIVKNNIVQRGQEGIGIYQMAELTTVENNTVFDCRTYNIYVDKGKNNIIRNNLVYATPNAIAGPNTRGFGIVLSAETWEYNYEAQLGWTTISGNYLAGLNYGITIGIADGSVVGWNSLRIYNNRIVDTLENLRFRRDNEGEWDDNFISGNYSFLYDLADNAVHTNKGSPASFTWNMGKDSRGILFNSPNYFTGPKLPSGNAMNDASGARINERKLLKNTGWRDLKPGEVDKTFFSFVGEKISKENIIPRPSGFTIDPSD